MSSGSALQIISILTWHIWLMKHLSPIGSITNILQLSCVGRIFDSKLKFCQLHFVNINMIKSWQSTFAEQLVARQTWLDPHLPSSSSSSRPASRSFSPSALSANTPPSTVLAGEGSASSGDQSSTDQWLAATRPTHPLPFLPTTGSSASPKEKHNHPIDFKWLIVTASQTRFYSSSIKLPLSLVQMVKSGRQVKSLFLVGNF